MTIGGEKGSVQNPFVRYAEEAGWEYVSSEAAARTCGVGSPARSLMPC